MPRSREYSIDHGELKRVVDDVLSSDDCSARLLDHLVRLEQAQQLEMQAALYETVVARKPIQDFWVLYNMARCYQMMGRSDACFHVTTAALHMRRHSSPTIQLYRDCSNYMADRGLHQAAIDLVCEQITSAPENPVAEPWQIMALASAGNVEVETDWTATPRFVPTPACETITVIEHDIRPRWGCPVYGSHTPAAILDLGRDMARNKVDVVRCRNAELLFCNDMTVVVDSDGQTVPGLSLATYAGAVRRKVEGLLASGCGQEIEADVVIQIGDRYTAPNICHFLYDHITRIDLYERAGVSLHNALMVTGDMNFGFQREAAAQTGIAHYIDMKRVARVKARELWISTNCRELLHPAHIGSSWAIDFLRRKFVSGERGEALKLYVSRADARTRKIHNEKEVIDELERHGFATILPGRMSLPAQVSAFSHATHIVGLHGAGLTNLVFAPEGAAVLEIFPPLYSTRAYAALAQATDWRYAALTGRDWHYDSPEFNDPTAGGAITAGAASRNVRVDMELLRSWLDIVC